MSLRADDISRLIEPTAAAMGLRLVRVSFGGNARPLLQIMAEPVDGRPMTVADCAALSRQISPLLDVHDPIGGAYELEVSSPGIDRPLIAREDFERFAGFEARIELRTGVAGRKRFRGVLVAACEAPPDTAPHRLPEPRLPGAVLLEEAGETWSLPFGDIVKAKLVLTDALIAASQRNLIPPPRNPQPQNPQPQNPQSRNPQPNSPPAPTHNPATVGRASAPPTASAAEEVA